MKNTRVLLLYFSFSSQTRNLLQAFSKGLESEGVEVFVHQLKPVDKLQFPLGTIASTLKMMAMTFFRKRVKIEPPSQDCYRDWDLIIVAGPTWSYNPSGPILSLFDEYSDMFKNRMVLPFISCRSYWRVHFWTLRYLLRKEGAKVLHPLVFSHVGKEPWLTIGVFLKLAGKVPEAGASRFRKYYSKYGHSREQVGKAEEMGELYGEKLVSGVDDIMALEIPRIK